MTPVRPLSALESAMLNRPRLPEPASPQAVLWISNTGEVACSQDGGGYLRAAVEHRPRAFRHVTPLDAWERVTALHVQAWAVDAPDLPPLACGTCGATPKVTP